MKMFDVDNGSWEAVYHFWFPSGLDKADLEGHRRMVAWWVMPDGAGRAVQRFSATVSAARAGQCDHWAREAAGRLALILALAQFPRNLFADSAEAYASDQAALRLALSGLDRGQFAELHKPWEKLFFLLPLAETEGSDHIGRIDRALRILQSMIADVPLQIRPIYDCSIRHVEAMRDVITRFGRFPHRNAALGRATTDEESAYLLDETLVHLSRPHRLPAGPKLHGNKSYVYEC